MKRTGVNYDYIIGLKKSEEGVIVVKYPILKHDREIEKAFDYLEDESRIASDVYNIFNFFSRTFDSCIYSDYQDCFIKEIISPEFNEHGYRKLYQENLENKYEIRLNRLSHTQLNDELVTQRIRKEVIRELSAIDREIKKKIIEKAIPYLYALEYENTLIRYNIDNECIVYSNERHGDGRNINNGKYRIVHKVNDDLSVVLETNFCYGNSSYFHITVIYMSIPLIPYSVWIK